MPKKELRWYLKSAIIFAILYGLSSFAEVVASANWGFPNILWIVNTTLVILWGIFNLFILVFILAKNLKKGIALIPVISFINIFFPFIKQNIYTALWNGIMNNGLPAFLLDLIFVIPTLGLALYFLWRK